MTPIEKLNAAGREDPAGYEPLGDEPAWVTRADGQQPSALVRFGVKLFVELCREQPDGNVFISPANIGFALSLAHSGARGATQAELAQVLELTGLSDSDIAEGNAVLKALLETESNAVRAMEALREGLDPESKALLGRPEPKVKLSIANSLWVRAGLGLRREFPEIARRFFSAEATELDFTQSGALETVNQWVSERTVGRIPRVIEGSMSDAALVLVCALYFRGEWAQDFKFDRGATKEREFVRLTGSKQRCQMMMRFGRYNYAESREFQAVQLPYAEGNLSMYIVLPAPRVRFADFVAQLSAPGWEGRLSSVAERTGKLILPRFKLEYQMELTAPLAALGARSAFRDGADFGNICAGPAYISKLVHKTFVDVNEEGTEAAAVTASNLVGSAQPKVPVFQMVVDRPFLCAIRHERTGALLFMGAIVNPS